MALETDSTRLVINSQEALPSVTMVSLTWQSLVTGLADEQEECPVLPMLSGTIRCNIPQAPEIGS